MSDEKEFELTEDEQKVLDLLTELHNVYFSMPVYLNRDAKEVNKWINRLQEKIMIRPAQRYDDQFTNEAEDE